MSATRVPAVASYMSVSLIVTMRSGDRALGGHLAGERDLVVDEAVVLGLVGGEPAVAVGVLLYLLDGLPGVEGDPLLQDLLGVEHLLSLDRDVTRGAAETAGRLVHHDPRVRRGIALARGAGAEQELAHAGRETQPVGRHVVGDVLHGVVDRHAGRDAAAG